MTYIRTFAQLSLAVQQEGAWENSGDITPDVLLQAVNYGLIKGFDIMVGKWEDYYTTTTVVPIIAGNDNYILGDIAQSGSIPLFYKLRHLDWSTDQVKWRRMYPIDLSQNYRYSTSTSSGDRPPRYQIRRASNPSPSASAFLVLVPAPGVNAFLRAFYIPLPLQFTSIADVTPYIFDVPAEEMLVVHLAQRFCLRRSDLDLTGINQQIAEDTAGLRSAADNRDAGEPFSLDPMGPPRSHWFGEDWEI